MRYVTYDDTGKLTGCYLQDLLPEHENCHIEISEDQAIGWPSFQANAERIGLEPAPPAPPVIVIPTVVSMRQARLALLAAGKLSLVQPAIDAMSEPQKSQANIEWNYATTVERSNSFTLDMAAALGLDSVALDSLFIAAAAL